MSLDNIKNSTMLVANNQHNTITQIFTAQLILLHCLSINNGVKNISI
jgi:hypothetical protein